MKRRRGERCKTWVNRSKIQLQTAVVARRPLKEGLGR